VASQCFRKACPRAPPVEPIRTRASYFFCFPVRARRCYGRLTTTQSRKEADRVRMALSFARGCLCANAVATTSHSPFSPATPHVRGRTRRIRKRAFQKRASRIMQPRFAPSLAQHPGSKRVPTAHLRPPWPQKERNPVGPRPFSDIRSRPLPRKKVLACLPHALKSQASDPGPGGFCPFLPA